MYSCEYVRIGSLGYEIKISYMVKYFRVAQKLKQLRDIRNFLNFCTIFSDCLMIAYFGEEHLIF